MKFLDQHYQNRSVYYGDTHEHSASGGTSDGKHTLREWIEACKEKNLDFEAILDHRQVRHMYQPEFDEYCFLCGTEPGTWITDADVQCDEHGMPRNCIHYCMLFRQKGELEKLLEAFPEFEFSGGVEGHFVYPNFTRERFSQLTRTVLDMGGFLVHPHPLSKATMHSDDPSQYVFADFMGIEVFYLSREYYLSPLHYALWKEILKRGHKVYACAGIDSHDIASGNFVTTVYLETLDRGLIVDTLRSGDFTAGNAGIRMCIGDTKMGGVHPFAEGEELEVSIGDIWHYDAEKRYRVVVLADEAVLASVEFSGEEPVELTLPVTKKGCYRVEVYVTDETLPLALGNPIWVE